MITEDDEWRCDCCDTRYSSEEYLEDGETDNPDYQEQYSCGECDNEEVCFHCITKHENVEDMCIDCVKADAELLIEKVVEKIIEKPVYIKDATTTTGIKQETSEEFEKRIMRS